MRIYRNDYRSRGHVNQGYSFHITMPSARAQAAKVQERSKRSHQPIETIMTDTLEIALTKLGVLEALNECASHASRTETAEKQP